MALAHLFGGEEIRKPKRKSDNIEASISNNTSELLEKRLCGSSFGVASFTKDLDIALPEQYLHIRYS